MPYSKNVFINCPFDRDYYPLLKSLIFTILYLDFVPRIAQTQSSGKSRIEQIMEHIEQSMYGIHDLSRSRALKKGEFPRFNMPYELGLDIGCYRYGGAKYKNKRRLKSGMLITSFTSTYLPSSVPKVIKTKV